MTIRSCITWKTTGNFFALVESVVNKIALEIEQIDRHLGAYDELLTKVLRERPNLVEMTALAAILQSFYTGIERIFTHIAEGIDGELPVGERWHRNLLDRMGIATLRREAVLSAALFEKFDEYLDFRHFYRHAYSYVLEWEKLEELVVPLLEVWDQTKRELRAFVEGLNGSTETLAGDPEAGAS
ncbi:MAG: hypothetical protein GY856_29950 [bacterium]|nr:hypothetical protein [bacterium]